MSIAEDAGNVGELGSIEAERRAHLRMFLRSRRSRLTPHDVGLPPGGPRRRSKGLRREEVALLAGISANWYTQFESGQNDAITTGTLNSVAHALRLPDVERQYLAALARVPLLSPVPAPQEPSPRLLAFLNELDDRPAVIWNRRRDAVAWNAVSAEIFHYSFDRPVWERNGWWRIFNHPNRENIWADWSTAARRAVSALRWQFSHEPEMVYDLLVELRANANFCAYWDAECEVVDWMLDPGRDIEIRRPDGRTIALEPITLAPPESSAFLVQIHRRIDRRVARELGAFFHISDGAARKVGAAPAG